MLQLSNRPEVLRLHNLQESERTKFCSDFNMALNQILPPALLRRFKSSSRLAQIAAAIPDIYYTFVTICHCKRRLGEEYTYVAMYKKDHYEQQGVLLNKKYRTLLFVLEIITRNALTPLLMKVFHRNADLEANNSSSWYAKMAEWAKRIIGSGQQIISNVEWLMLMLYMLEWNKHYNLLQTLLGIEYAYTYKNDKPTKINYKIEGLLILTTLSIKLLKHLHSLYSQQKPQSLVQQRQKPSISQGQGNGLSRSEKVLCRICYDDIKCRSATRCGHVFCWECIVKTLEISEECPVCRFRTAPNQVVQLRNY